MKIKKIAGLIAIVAIVAIVIFSGCIESGKATPSTLTTPTPKQIEASDGQVTIILDKLERANVMPPDIAEELSAGYYSPRKIPTPTGGCNFVCIYLTIAHIENVHLVNPLGYGDEGPVLLDAQGHEYESVGALVRGVRYLDPHDITGPSEVVEGSTGFLVFEVPKHRSPARFSFVYSFKETWEDKSAKRGQIEIYLQVTPTPTLTPTPAPMPTVTPVPLTPTPMPTLSPTATVTEIPATKEKEVPGFEATFAIAGLLAVAYLLRRRK